MRRFTVLLALTFLTMPLAIGFAEAPVYTPAALQMEKECVIIGRVVGTDVLLYPMKKLTSADQPLPGMARIGGFEVLNVASGDWIPLSPSEQGYFCANVGMGQYHLRGRDSEGRPYLIHRFNVPMNMAVNLGTFWVDACDPKTAALDKVYSYDRTAAWRIYRKGANHVAMRVEHVTTPEAYEDCETWFAGCHEEVYQQFEKVMARR